MKTWYEIINDVKLAKGKDKQVVLEQNKNNEILRDVLHFLNNPRITTGISKKKYDKDVQLVENEIENISELMNYIKLNNSGKDDNVSRVKSYVNSIDSNINDLEKQTTISLILKDLPIGVSSTTINKVWKDLVPVFKLMKGKKYENQNIKKEFCLTLKLDGNSATVFNLDDETYILSRSGAKIEGLEYIEEYYREKLPKNYVYCGELLKKNYDKLPHGKLFQETNGIVNSKIENKEGLQHVVFDMIPYHEYKSGKFTEVFNIRRRNLTKSIDERYYPFSDKFYDVEYVPCYYMGDSSELIPQYLDDAKKMQQEGLMLNVLDAKYKFGPTDNLLKVKDFYTVDLLVTGLKEHIRGNMVGAIEVDYKGFNVGVSGIKDEDRRNWWNNPETIVGKIVEVKYFRETSDKFGNLSLRFPTVVGIRNDKTFDDVSYD